MFSCGLKTRARAEKKTTRRARFETLENRETLDAYALNAPLSENFQVEIAQNLDDSVAILDLRSLADEPVATWSIDWGDGTIEELDAFGYTLRRAHRYADRPQDVAYRIALTVVDASGLSSAEQVALAIVRVPASVDDQTGRYCVDNFCDAEKGSYTQSSLCWAATSANALYYAGWAPKDAELRDLGDLERAFENEDDVYDYFVEHFDNAGGSAFYGCQWFMTGEYPPDGLIGWAWPDINSGGFHVSSLPSIESIVTHCAYANASNSADPFRAATQTLRAGGAVCASLAFYTNAPGSVLTLAHSVSLWGFEYDPNRSPNDPRYYTAIIISDSDDDRYQGKNAENQLMTLEIRWNEQHQRYLLIDYYAGECWLEELITVQARRHALGGPS